MLPCERCRNPVPSGVGGFQITRHLLRTAEIPRAGLGSMLGRREQAARIPEGAVVSTHFAQRTYAPVDAADKLSCRPDFAIALYPGHLWAHEDEDHGTRDETDLSLRPDISVRADQPPTFLLQAEDDHVDGVEQSLAYYVALKKAGVPTEMHLYAQGGHAFGLRTSKLPIAQWPRLVETWLGTIGVVDAALAH